MLSQFIDFEIAVNSSNPSREGFGIIGIVSHRKVWSGTDRTRQYSDTADMVTDGFSATGIEVLQATRIFQQNPSVPFVSVLRCDGAEVIQQYTVGCVDALDDTEYILNILGETFEADTITYTSSGDDTVQGIHEGLITLLNAVSDANYTATFSPLASLSAQPFTANDVSSEFTRTAHGLNTGDGPVWVSNSGGALPAGLVAATNYWAIKIDANTFQLATSLANALAGTFQVITTNGTGTQTETPQAGALSPVLPFLITGNGIADWFSIEVEATESDLLSIEQTHADFGVDAELDLVIAKDNTWYWLQTAYNSHAYVLQTADWVEENKKAYMVDSCDNGAITTVVGDGTDVLADLQLLTYTRTLYCFHTSPAAFMCCGLMGLVAPKNVGLWNVKGRTIVGVDPVPLNTTQTNNLLARLANSYTTEAGLNMFWEGTLGNTQYGYIDVTVDLDWVAANTAAAVVGTQNANDIVNYEDDDIALYTNAIVGQVILPGISDQHKIMNPGDPNDPSTPPPSMTFPLVATIDPSVRATREVPNGQLTFQLANAVNKVQVRATVTF